MTIKDLQTALLTLALLPLLACGNDENDSSEQSDSYASESNISIDELPDDFPRALILPNYDTVNYTDMRPFGGMEGVGFESQAPVEDTIRHYTDLLGEPAVSVGEDDDRASNWHETPWSPWIVGIMGDSGQSLVSVTKFQQ